MVDVELGFRMKPECAIKIMLNFELSLFIIF